MPAAASPTPRLSNGSRVAVVGGGPAGSFFSYFLIQTAERAGIGLDVQIYEPREFSRRGPGSCNMCGGIISESLVQSLASEGLILPLRVLQRRLDSYYLHMDVGSVRIPTPLQEKRIASVHRGSGPRSFVPLNDSSFDAHVLEQARKRGARVVPERVRGIGWKDDRPEVRTRTGRSETYDLVAVATGLNGSGLKHFDVPGAEYVPPERTKTYICEFYLGRNMTRQCFGSSMHIFLLNIPRLEFAAIIPKSDYVTVCLLGRDIDSELAESFLKSDEVRRWMPPLWQPPRQFCHCMPRINIRGARRPFAERVVFVGDSAATKLYKDGIGTAYRTAKAAAVTAVFEGIAAEDFRRRYWPTCQAIESDNKVGKLIFKATKQVQKRALARRGVWRMVRDEQYPTKGIRPRMSMMLWDVFTGSASYGSVLARALRPSFAGRFLWSLGAGHFEARRKPKRRTPMAVSTKGVLGKRFRDGEVIYRQGDPGDCMYVIQEGKVHVLRREGNKEFCLAELKDGDFFGEMAVFEKETRRATVRAVGDVHVSTLERDSLLKAIHQNPSLAYRLVQQMAYRIQELEMALIRRTSAALREEPAPAP